MRELQFVLCLVVSICAAERQSESYDSRIDEPDVLSSNNEALSRMRRRSRVDRDSSFLGRAGSRVASQGNISSLKRSRPDEQVQEDTRSLADAAEGSYANESYEKTRIRLLKDAEAGAIKKADASGIKVSRPDMKGRVQELKHKARMFAKKKRGKAVLIGVPAAAALTLAGGAAAVATAGLATVGVAAAAGMANC
jgi:hypothetical protein